MLMEKSADAQAPLPGFKALPLVRQMPELAGHLQAVEGMLQLRREPVWVILPCRIEVK